MPGPGKTAATKAGTSSGELHTVRAHEMLLGDRLVAAELDIEDGRITAIRPLPDEAPRLPGTLVVPDGLQVLPGNVDTHVHINEPGRTEWEGFATATRAAALGGVTTLVDMPLNSIPPTIDVASLRVKQAAARDALAVDLGFWGGIVPGNTAQLRALWEAGVMGFKCFLLPSGVDEFPPVDAAQLRAAMHEVATFDGLVIVHAEDASTIDAAPAVPSARYTDFVASRPESAEVTAIAGLIEAVRETGAAPTCSTSPAPAPWTSSSRPRRRVCRSRSRPARTTCASPRRPCRMRRRSTSAARRSATPATATPSGRASRPGSST